MCVCNSTGNFLLWITSITNGIIFSAGAMAGDTGIIGEFDVVLTEKVNGFNISTLTFNPSTVRATGSGGVNVTCSDTTVASTANVVVTSAGIYYNN